MKNIFSSSNKISKPIICVGNLIAGGTGKTPVAIELGILLRELEIGFAYLSRGYGGDIKDFTLVQRELHSASQVGDEPLLLSEISNTFISKNKVFGALQIAKMSNKKLIIMDDGLQNLSLIKDLSIVVIDGVYGFGNGFIMPAGPLRETIVSGIKKTDLVIIIGEDKLNVSSLCIDKKVIFANIKEINAAGFKNKKVIAFCGIGRPDKFFNSLRKIKCNIVQAISYSDHYIYKSSDLEKMILLAKKNSALLITTKKDWIRLDKEYRRQIKYLDIRIEFDDTDYIKSKLLNLLNK